MLAHPTIEKFAEPVAAERAESTRRDLNPTEIAVLDQTKHVKEECFVSDRISRFAARIIIEKKTQLAYIYAGAFDSNLEISLGVQQIIKN